MLIGKAGESLYEDNVVNCYMINILHKMLFIVLSPEK